MKFLELENQGKIVRLWAEKRDSETWIHFNHHNWVYKEDVQKKTKQTSLQKTPSGVISSPMPGKIVKIHSQLGEKVKMGQVIIVIEAMKMEYRLCAGISGKIEKLSCSEGDQVHLGQQLAFLKEVPN